MDLFLNNDELRRTNCTSEELFHLVLGEHSPYFTPTNLAVFQKIIEHTAVFFRDELCVLHGATSLENYIEMNRLLLLADKFEENDDGFVICLSIKLPPARKPSKECFVSGCIVRVDSLKSKMRKIAIDEILLTI